MPRAEWEGAVLAESDDCVVVEGNQYFPPGSLHLEYFRPSEKTTVCPWKGVARYYHVEVNGKINRDAARYYRDPMPSAKQIKGRVAFWRGVQVQA